jgi:carboxyl-terminal processing protease
VKSDVVAPDQYAYVDIGEKDEDNPLVWDQIAAAPFTTWNGYENFSQTIQSSNKRVEENNLFQLIDKNARWIREQQDKDDFSLNLDQFSSTIDQDEATAEEFKALDDYKNNLSFRSPDYERQQMELDTILAEKRKRWKKALSRDLYVEEAVLILEDLKLNFIPSKPLAMQQ